MCVCVCVWGFNDIALLKYLSLKKDNFFHIPVLIKFTVQINANNH